MSTEQSKAVCRRWFDEGWNKRNLAEVTDEVYAADCVFSDGPDVALVSVEHVKSHCAEFIAAFPDSYMTVEDQVAEGDKVTTRWILRGTYTNKAQWLGIPPTGQEITMRGIVIQRLEDGKVVEEWEGKDRLGFRRQLGQHLVL